MHHLPILIDIDLRIECLQEDPPRLRWNWSSADWTCYKTAVETTALQARARELSTLSEMISFITEAMLDLKSAETCRTVTKKAAQTYPKINPNPSHREAKALANGPGVSPHSPQEIILVKSNHNHCFPLQKICAKLSLLCIFGGLTWAFPKTRLHKKVIK